MFFLSVLFDLEELYRVRINHFSCKHEFLMENVYSCMYIFFAMLLSNMEDVSFYIETYFSIYNCSRAERFQEQF